MPSAIPDTVNGVSGITTRTIVYNEAMLHALSTTQENLPSGLAKRFCSLPDILVASSLILTTPTLSLTDLRQWDIAELSTSTQTASTVQKARRITLREARQIALRAHYQFEEGLRNDRIQEARLMQNATHEIDA